MEKIYGWFVFPLSLSPNNIEKKSIDLLQLFDKIALLIYIELFYKVIFQQKGLYLRSKPIEKSLENVFIHPFYIHKRHI